MQTATKTPWDFFSKYKDIDFSGEWPTVPEMFFITAKRFPERPCFTDFEGEGGSKNTLLYSQVEQKVKALASWFTENRIQKGDLYSLHLLPPELQSVLQITLSMKKK